MAPKKALRRYFQVFAPSMAGYVASIFLASGLIDDEDPITVGKYILALVPAVFVFAFIWGQARYVREMDEFQRKVQVEALMCGLMITMAIATAWGLLEFYTEVPRLPVFYILPIFYGVFGLSNGIIARRNKAGCSDLML